MVSGVRVDRVDGILPAPWQSVIGGDHSTPVLLDGDWLLVVVSATPCSAELVGIRLLLPTPSQGTKVFCVLSRVLVCFSASSSWSGALQTTATRSRAASLCPEPHQGLMPPRA